MWRLLRSQSGITLLNIIFLFVLIGALMAAGALLVEPMVKRGKIDATKTIINGAVDAVLSWSIANGRIPPDAGAFAGVVGNPNDAWGSPLLYLFDSSLTNAGTGGLCGATATGSSYNGQPVAFVVLSAGDDHTVDSVPGASGALPGGNLGGLSMQDIFRVVSLEELKNRGGCFGTTAGRLRIINNELPRVCPGRPYTATIYAEGGVPGYQWRVTNLPAALSTNPGAATWSSAAQTLQITGTGALGTVTVEVRDNQGNVAQKQLSIASAGACGPVGAQITFAKDMGTFVVSESSASAVTVNPDNSLSFGGLGYNATGCFWYPIPQTLRSSTMRGYYEFRYANADNSADSRAYADGFTFTLIEKPNNGAQPLATYLQNFCGTGGAGSNLGFLGLPGDSVAFETDIYPSDATYADPAPNHISIVKAGTNRHGAATTMGNNPRCNGADPGCEFPGPNTWLEDAQLHKVRMEVITNLNNTCTVSGGGTYALMKVWMDCTAAACMDFTQDYGAAPTISHCFNLPLTNGLADPNNVIFGFTEATGAAVQNLTISNFGIGFYPYACGGAPSFTATPSPLPPGVRNTAYSGASVSGSSGLPPYNWTHTLNQAGLNLNLDAAGNITGTPTTAGTYNPTITLADSCATPQTVTQTFPITIYNRASYTVRNSTGATFRVIGGPYGTCTAITSNNTFSLQFASYASPVRIYTGGNCTTTPAPLPSVTFADADAVDDAGDGDGQVQINNAFVLRDR
jgi:hypothetical protein